MTTLADVEELVARVVEGSVTETFALEVLAHNGLTPDAEHLSHAVEALRDREGLKDGRIDPLIYLGEDPHMGIDSWEVAVTMASRDFAWNLSQLARPLEVLAGQQETGA